MKSANDRYANLETTYLLRRLETYLGIFIVTTKAGENIDAAFHRRTHVVVEQIVQCANPELSAPFATTAALRPPRRERGKEAAHTPLGAPLGSLFP